jgi:hypothetical protein
MSEDLRREIGQAFQNFIQGTERAIKMKGGRTGSPTRASKRGRNIDANPISETLSVSRPAPQTSAAFKE